MSDLPTISLPGTEITTSLLGFGCSRLLGPVSSVDALKLLETAYDAGIRHFDVARVYGSGDAEGLLGRFAARRRDQVTITTKFGIKPLPGVGERRLLRSAARALMKVSPGVRSFLGRQGARLVRRGGFDVEEARTSLETSLRELRTDYVDILLLHDCTVDDCSPELLEFLRSAVAAGKIRAFGVGTSADDAAEIVESAPAFAAVLQFEHGALRPTVDDVDPTRARATITHGAFDGLESVRAYLAANQEVRSTCSAELGLDCGSDGVLAGLMLSYALRTNTRGPVLVSSTTPAHISANAAAAADLNSRLTEGAERFAELVRESMARRKHHPIR